MRNSAPIFLNCFSRGGSNILWNIFLSHPQVCSPIRETVQIFGAGFTHATWEGYAIALLSRQRHLFDQWYLQPRRPISPRVKRLIDRTLHKYKMKTLTNREMSYKFEDQRYTAEEVVRARLVAKNNNGLVFLSDLFLDIYPDATFISLVRHPLALYESHRRRKIIQSVGEFADFYNRVAGCMLRDAGRIARYHIVRFEDLLADPVSWTHTLYDWADLNFDKIRRLRFKAKPHLRADGQHTTAFEPGSHHWFPLDEITTILDPDINAYQIERVDEASREQLLALTASIREQLAYGESDDG